MDTQQNDVFNHIFNINIKTVIGEVIVLLTSQVAIFVYKCLLHYFWSKKKHITGSLRQQIKPGIQKNASISRNTVYYCSWS